MIAVRQDPMTLVRLDVNVSGFMKVNENRKSVCVDVENQLSWHTSSVFANGHAQKFYVEDCNSGWN